MSKLPSTNTDPSLLDLRREFTEHVTREKQQGLQSVAIFLPNATYVPDIDDDALKSAMIPGTEIVTPEQQESLDEEYIVLSEVNGVFRGKRDGIKLPDTVRLYPPPKP